jgi:hypothetical protein
MRRRHRAGGFAERYSGRRRPLERPILRHLERVEQLPSEVQAEIAMRVGNLIELARPVSDALLERFVQVVRQEQRLALEQGAKSDMDPLWAAPAISEAWCNARLGLANGNLNRHSAVAITLQR